MILDARSGPIGGRIGRILAGEVEESRAQGRAFACIFRPFGAAAGGLGWLVVGAGELGWQGEVAGRRQGQEEREKNEKRRGGRNAQKKREEEKGSRSNSTDPILSGSIQPVRFRIQNFKFLLCLGTENEVRKFRKNSRKLRKIRRF